MFERIISTLDAAGLLALEVERQRHEDAVNVLIGNPAAAAVEEMLHAENVARVLAEHARRTQGFSK